MDEMPPFCPNTDDETRRTALESFDWGPQPQAPGLTVHAYLRR
jgi:hypothetical protein